VRTSTRATSTSPASPPTPIKATRHACSRAALAYFYSYKCGTARHSAAQRGTARHSAAQCYTIHGYTALYRALYTTQPMQHRSPPATRSAATPTPKPTPNPNPNSNPNPNQVDGVAMRDGLAAWWKAAATEPTARHLRLPCQLTLPAPPAASNAAAAGGPMTATPKRAKWAQHHQCNPSCRAAPRRRRLSQECPCDPG